MVSMVRNGSQTKASLGKLVAKTFVEPPRHSPSFDSVIHLDGDSFNNHPSNLMWRPFWFANTYKRQFRVLWADTPPVRDFDSDFEYANAWDVVVHNGLLMRDVLVHTHDQTPVFPTSQRFEWIA